MREPIFTELSKTHQIREIYIQWKWPRNYQEITAIDKYDLMNCFAERLTDERRFILFAGGFIVGDSLEPATCRTHTAPHAANSIWTCAEPGYRVCWMILCSGNNLYTTTPHIFTRNLNSRFWIIVHPAAWVKWNLIHRRSGFFALMARLIKYWSSLLEEISQTNFWKAYFARRVLVMKHMKKYIQNHE